MTKTKVAVIYLVVLAFFLGTNVYIWRCYDDMREENESLVRQNQELRGHVETLAGKSLELMRRLEAANDRAEAMLK